MVRDCVASVLGVRTAVEIWWTPQLPVIYINNPKCGCSTVKNSLKQAQAERFREQGLLAFNRHHDPHVADDCLRMRGVDNLAHGQRRLVISCARNPYTRALSAYLDKIAGSDDISQYRELKGKRPDSFDAFLDAIAVAKRSRLDPHFAPQSLNLDLPKVQYDAIFYLENIASLRQALKQMVGEFTLETFAPHSRSAHEKVKRFYSPGAAQLVQSIYAEDFTRFGYSRDLARVTDAPGKYWTRNGVVPLDDTSNLEPTCGIASLMPALRYRRLVDAQLI
jgi:hypothetical protein